MKKILIVTGDGGEAYETLYAIHRFAEAGYSPQVAAPSKKRLHLVQHDFEPGWDTYIERHGYGVESNLTFDDVKVADFEAVLLIGGRAPEYLRHDRRVIAIVKAFSDQKKCIFSICHGIQILIAAGLVKGKRVTCYENIRYEVEAAGGEFIGTSEAVRDGKIVSSQTWMSHPDFFREIFLCLEAEGSKK